MKERPISFTGDSLPAILDGRKTQTRRVLRGGVLPPGDASFVAVRVVQVGEWFHVEGDLHGQPVMYTYHCPYGVIGDRLWVREAAYFEAGDLQGAQRSVRYLADGVRYPGLRARPALYMPRWACRLVLEIESVRLERLQDISEADSLAEGVSAAALAACTQAGDPRPAACAYRVMWEAINARRGFPWEINPWVWAVEFRPT